jgi:hypothetical protein
MKRCILRVIVIFLGCALTSCTIDLSKKKPYREAIGKQFVLQQDFYIYYFNDYGEHSYLSSPCKLCLGTTHTLAGTFSYGLSERVDEKYIGSKNFWVTLEGVLHKGTVVTLKRVLEQRTFENTYFYYIISPNQGPFAGQEIDPYDITHMFSNPPYSKTWSDPPIFESNAALPLPSDGIWWK